MKVATAHVVGVSRLAQGRPHNIQQNRGEDYNQYEERTALQRMHINDDGVIVVTGQSWEKCLCAGAKRDPIKLRGNTTYTKYFESGVVVNEDVLTGISQEDVQFEWLFVPSDGKPGGGNRVWKRFPYIEEGWEADVNFLIMDPKIPDQVFAEVLQRSGVFIGLGRWRPQNGGKYGRFQLTRVEFNMIESDLMAGVEIVKNYEISDVEDEKAAKKTGKKKTKTA